MYFFLIIESGHPSKGEGCDFFLRKKQISKELDTQWCTKRKTLAAVL